MVDQAANISEAVVLMESINYGILDLESLLDGSRQTSYQPEPVAICELDEDDFPELNASYSSKTTKSKAKGKRARREQH